VAEKTGLLAELKTAGVKHDPDAVVRIAKTKDGTIVFMEKGRGKAETNKPSGLQHIIEEHREDFTKKGITEAQIPDAVIKAVTEGKVIGTTGRNRPIYEVDFHGETRYIAVTVGSNGYIVSANPVSVYDISGEGP
jgi:hypothetical protein